MSAVPAPPVLEPLTASTPHLPYDDSTTLRIRHARVAVILVSSGDYTPRYLAECYASLRAQTYSADLVTVFVVTNGVTEENRRLTRHVAPQARLLHNSLNLGWSGGNNTAIRVALDEGFDYLVLLNVDTVVEPEWLLRLVEAADASTQTHIWQSTILLHGTSQINSCGNRIHYLGYGYCQGYGEPRTRPPSGTAPDAASGAAMLVRREVFERIGLFRDEYFMYYDDVEFCWRARLAGYNIGLAHRSICYHKHASRDPSVWLYYFQRNRWMTLLTLEKWRTLAVTAPCWLATEALLSVYFIARGWGGAQWRACRELLKGRTWRTILAHRRHVRGLRIRNDAQIVKRFAGGVAGVWRRHPVIRYVVNPLLESYWAVVRTFIVW